MSCRGLLGNMRRWRTRCAVHSSGQTADVWFVVHPMLYQKPPRALSKPRCAGSGCRSPLLDCTRDRLWLAAHRDRPRRADRHPHARAGPRQRRLEGANDPDRRQPTDRACASPLARDAHQYLPALPALGELQISCVRLIFSINQTVRRCRRARYRSWRLRIERPVHGLPPMTTAIRCSARCTT